MENIFLLEAAVFELVKEYLKPFLQGGNGPDRTVIAEGSSDQSTVERSILRKEGGKGIIPITGFLQKSASLASMMFIDVTGYRQIAEAIRIAEADEEIKEIELHIDSPGGQAAGIVEASDAIRDAKKPVTAIVDTAALSGAYWLASQADKIIAKNRGASFGSIGVLTMFFVVDFFVTVTSTEAPNKAPDPTTEAGLKAIKERLDDLHSLFAEAVASGRGITVERVNKDFGQGGVVLAEDALKRGMIDAIGSDITTSTEGDEDEGASGKNKDKDKSEANNQGGKVMSDELKGWAEKLKGISVEVLMQFAPEVVKGIQDAAVTGERERVGGHLVFIETSKETVLTNIKEGKDLTPDTQAGYIADMSRSAMSGDRVEDNPDAVTPASDGDSAGGSASGDRVKDALTEMVAEAEGDKEGR